VNYKLNRNEIWDKRKKEKTNWKII
jgi:hypothetical protein